MIISRTPFRVSFFGGGTDYPQWYSNNKGKVISVTINQYCHISCRKLPKFFDYKYRLRYFKDEKINKIDDIQHPSIRETLRLLKINDGLEIIHSGDLPAMSGLGSSSTFTVGLLNLLYAYINIKKTKREIALDAINIEQNLLAENVGSQDQVAASFGGLNKIVFNQANNINVQPINISNESWKNLENHFFLLFSGFSRNANDIAYEQIINIKKNSNYYQDMLDIVDEAEKFLYDDKFIEFGKLLNTQWEIKKKLSNSISNSSIDNIYNHAIKNGAIGGKLLGAGSGGFFVFFVTPDKRANLIKKLKKFIIVPFKFDSLGSQIIYFPRT